MRHFASRRDPDRFTRRVVLGLGALAAAALILGPSTPAQAAPGDQLLGKWKAKKMQVGGKTYAVKAPRKIVFEFQAGGRFVVVQSDGRKERRDVGTWTATAKVVKMTVKGDTQTARYKISGGKLRLDTKLAGRKAVYHMAKLR